MDCLPGMPPKKRLRAPIVESLADGPGLADVRSPSTSEGKTGVDARPDKHCNARGGEAAIEVDVQLEAVVDDEGPPTPVYGGSVEVVEAIEVVEGELSADEEEDEAPVTSEELEGHWVVLSNGTVQIGTVDVSFSASEEERGIARFRDVVTQLHTKHRMVPDPDTVLGCGPADQVKTALPGRPMVILEPDFEASQKFWRVSREKDAIVWRKTSLLKLDEALGWYRDVHRDDVTIRNGGFLAWTRELPEDARVISAKELEAPKKRRRGPRMTHKKRSTASNWRAVR